MKKTLALILLGALMAHFSFGQIALEDLKQIDKEAIFKDGKDGFSNHFSRNLRFPFERGKRPGVCTILGVMKISKEGKILEVGSLNKAPLTFLNAFKEAARSTKGKWMPTSDDFDFHYVVVPIVFKFEKPIFSVNVDKKAPFIPDPIYLSVSVRAMDLNAMVSHALLQQDETQGQVATEAEDKVLLDKAGKEAAKGKLAKAAKIMEVLLTRQPFKKDYYLRIIELYTKAGDTQQATYYTVLAEKLFTEE